MIEICSKTLIILPHLDDEFALTPIIQLMSYLNNEIKIIYCAERITSTLKKQKQRRYDNIRALEILGIKKSQIIYLNDYFLITDNRLIDSSLKIFNFLNNFIKKNLYSQIFTLTFEGGHPDHDQLSLIINKLSLLHNFNPFYFPAYNSRRTLILPFSVLRPLKSQESSIKIMELGIFCWLNAIKIALIYKTERNAFLFLLPTLIFKTIFSRKLLYFTKIDIKSVDWERSLSKKRYKIDKKDLSFLDN